MKASVIVRTKDSANIISQTLKALYSQTFKDFELVVVDSGSSDNTLELIKNYKHRLIEVKPEDYQPGVVLNGAIETCSSEYIVFLNSDTVMLTKNCLGNLLKELECSDAAYARQVARPEAHSWVRRDYDISFPKDKKQPFWMHFSLPLACMKKSAWNRLPFYTQAWASEDTKWGYEAKQLGLKISYANEAIVMHSHNYTLKQLFNRRYVEGEADVFIFQKKYNFVSCVRSYLGSIFNDAKYFLQNQKVKELANSFLLRAVYHYSYYLGHKFGQKRVDKRELDLTFGNYQ